MERTEITPEDREYLGDLVHHIEKWVKRHQETANKIEISKKITGFIGEAIVFQKLNKRKIKSIWKGGTHKGYDICVEGSRRPYKISIKTTWNALRYRGRRDKKKPYEYQWSLSWSDKDSAKNPHLFFVFVDLRKLESTPDFYIVPSRIILMKHFRYARREGWNWPRYHPPCDEMQRYKNNWGKFG